MGRAMTHARRMKLGLSSSGCSTVLVLEAAVMARGRRGWRERWGKGDRVGVGRQGQGARRERVQGRASWRGRRTGIHLRKVAGQRAQQQLLGESGGSQQQQTVRQLVQNNEVPSQQLTEHVRLAACSPTDPPCLPQS